jgi:hypothetical protein
MPTVLWRNEEGGAERCVLEEAEGGFRLRGTVLLAEQGAPAEIRYAVLVDRRWRTQDVEVLVEFAGGELREPVALGALWSGKERPPELRDCVDVDLSFSPVTNTLPIRRLGLEVGESAEVVVAWLRWPELTVEPSEQRYDRLGADVYRFSSGTFRADLTVDEHGLVLDYPGLWRVVGRA